MNTGKNTSTARVNGVRRHRMFVVSGLTSVGFGVILAAWVGYEWFVVGTSHEVIALLAAFCVIFGSQLLVWSTLTGMLLTLHREQTSFLDAILEEEQRER